MVGVPITVLYLLSIVCIAAFPASFACYSYDTFGFLVNGIIGIVGFVFYMLNAAVTGEVTPMDELLHCPNDTCAKRDLIVLYAVISSVRFLSWYAEFFISFVYILFCLRYAVAMTLLRYVTHSFTAATSIVTLCLVSLRRFPHDELYGSSLVVPIIIQLLIFFYTLLSFLLIRSSRLYRRCDVTLQKSLRVSRHLVQKITVHVKWSSSRI